MTRRTPLACAIHLALSGLILAPLPLSVLLPALATAQDRSGIRDYRIPAGPLGAALSQFATQAGVTLSFAAEQTRDLTSQGLHGAYGLEEGLAQLLAGSGWQAQRQENGSYVLVKMETGDDPDLVSLDIMRVEDNQLGTITEHTKSYTPGTIASATRLVLTPRETPQTVTVVTRQHMDDFNLTSLDKVIDHTPGVTRTSWDSFRSQYYARGFQITNFQYDGIPTLADSINYTGQTSSDMIQYDRIEVIKGASGLTTGAGGPGATLNLVRKKPTHEFSGHVTAEAGRWDNYRSELDISGPLNESGTFRGRIAGAFQDRQSYLDRFKEQTRAYYGILEYDLTPQTMLTFGGNSDERIPTANAYGGIPMFDSNNNEVHVSHSYNTGADWSRSEQFSHAFFTQLDHEFDNGWSGRAYYTYQRNAYDSKMGVIRGMPNVDNDNSSYVLMGYNRYRVRTQALEVYARGPFELFGRTHELAVGASGYKNDTEGKGSGASVRVPIDDFYEWDGDIQQISNLTGIRTKWGERVNQRAFYSSARFSLSDDLALILGGRVTNYKAGGDNHMRETGEVVPFAGITYDLSENYSVYASYTKIFQPQSARDKDNAVLDPDEGDSYEAGLKGEWFNGRLNASLAYYEIRQDNRAESVGWDDVRSQTIYEGKKAKTKGVELEVTGELAPGWNIQAGFTHQVIREDRTNDKLTTQAPENQFKIYTNYRLPGTLNKLTVGGGASYQGTTWQNADYLDPPRQLRQEAFWLVNLMSKYQFTDDISATLNINNLFDKHYYTGYGDKFYPNVAVKTYGDPRNMMLTTRWDF
ncbi:ferripyoverdine receptor [Azotobacter vinelandii CA]|uniref:Ferripyoverdine receptor n=2 Tax=Azotobacter vinelandii TaxID=354 RepID=C1DEB8_AZOVD|nr:TonB-dependent receptor [Azotobacter vinelandii]ACO80226.1 ferripyoverdine receptor [Azotobacter vinelandii DJ]AGK13516.1 ferripyoverdine receptor [Azotobacter vinelandii CA]AGK17934.1 ferripyoverdine receptor [Azotobacter vinelandii CA6]SFX72741.1 outer-membrane receptor for ferric coprogen and ferric-rhodotorulic acid [Azotobacter vinelandii]GLK61812.1 ferripyoverdine receptor [Azotobacter vinelandii]